MIKKLYSLYDVKTQYFLAPQPFHSEEDARRGFAGLFNNPNIPPSQHPEDFKVFFLGDFNDNSGTIVGEEYARYVCDLTTLDYRKESTECTGQKSLE